MRPYDARSGQSSLQATPPMLIGHISSRDFLLQKTKLHMRKFKLRNVIVSGILMIAVSLLSSSSLLAQDVGDLVHGKVVDSSGNPVSGASVLNVKSGKGSSADQDGNFSIRAVKGQTLQISFVGYQAARVVYRGQASLAITLLRENSSLGDVVVIGYGTQRKEAVTGSVASISGNNLREVPSANISDALQGRLPGVAIQQTSSQPGATMQIRIRGTRSLTATNDPLIVLDGIPFPGNISDIDMNDVRSVDVLKDASATAIYGSRGANGVILITTYKGISGSGAAHSSQRLLWREQGLLSLSHDEWSGVRRSAPGGTPVSATEWLHTIGRR